MIKFHLQVIFVEWVSIVAIVHQHIIVMLHLMMLMLSVVRAGNKWKEKYTQNQFKNETHVYNGYLYDVCEENRKCCCSCSRTCMKLLLCNAID